MLTVDQFEQVARVALLHDQIDGRVVLERLNQPHDPRMFPREGPKQAGFAYDIIQGASRSRVRLANHLACKFLLGGSPVAVAHVAERTLPDDGAEDVVVLALSAP